jgi:hypothetical protein
MYPMKSIKFIPIPLLLFVSVCLNAQTFIGGNVGFSTSKSEEDRTHDTLKINNCTLGLMPSLGRYITNNLAIGIALNISSTKRKVEYYTTSIEKSSNIGINPFIRYYAIRWNKFSIYGQGNMGINFSKTKEELTETITLESNATQIDINIYPGLSYNINEKLSLITSINILSLGYNYTVTKDDNSKEKSSAFSIGVGLSNILQTGSINIGAIYSF